jgi:hypothetical protein
MKVENCPFCGCNGILDLDERLHFQCIDCMKRFAILDVSDTVPFFEDTQGGLFPVTPPPMTLRGLRGIRSKMEEN